MSFKHVRCPIHTTIVGAILLGSGVDRVAAQTEQAESKTICWPGGPLPRCKYFWLTEIGGRYRVSSVFEGAVDHTLEGGIMWNVSPTDALGATVAFINPLNADRSRSGVRLRYRRWLGNGVGLEGAAGALFEVNGSVFPTPGVGFRPRLPGFSGQAMLDVRDLVGVGVQVDVIRYAPTGSVTEWFVGGRLGSKAGAAGGVVLAVIAAIAVLVVLATFGSS